MTEARVEVRPIVRWFAEQMELALQMNDHKGGWHNCKPYDLARRVDQESAELLEALCLGRAEPVLSEAADVANMAMMVADHYRKGGPSRDQGNSLDGCCSGYGRGFCECECHK